ncbi:CPBP family intramembrane glutamic endopeptidase [Oceanobacillus halotolerans]|uniref:CPBP family intramembrane glutamic endopeptidase n=1 Tax=Oceanobacillus halotolerans TaxID=2663380 RepID=UPI0013DC38F0|nr:CPBP family intramembrane glutamic endopeptidase [Oceanobacillus halotolerans]
MKSQILFIIISTLITCSILAFIEHGIEINYLVKTGSKIALFALNIALYIKLYNDFNIKDIITLKRIDKREWKRILLLGITSASFVLIAFFIAEPFIDLDRIQQDLDNRLGITASGFIIVGLYISFGNSFLEEYFFRGFIFFNLPRKLAYMYSPLLFATYHIPMIMLWFEPVIIMVCFFGLWAIGITFHKVNNRNSTIWSSWIIHIFADMIIIIIGCTIIYT